MFSNVLYFEKYTYIITMAEVSVNLVGLLSALLFEAKGCKN